MRLARQTRLQSHSCRPFSNQVCEGPLTSAGPAAGVAIWGNSLRFRTKLTLDIEQAGGRTLATAELEPGNAETEWTARLSRTVDKRRPAAGGLRHR